MPDFSYGLCACGCGGKTQLCPANNRSKGWVKGEPKRFLLYHKLPRKPDNYLVNEETGCWEWQGSRTNDGYAREHREGRLVLMHRWYYELAHGPIPEGMDLDHLCRNRCCVNPAHLEAVPPFVNFERGNHVRLSLDTAREIRALKGAESARSLAARYGVNRNEIYHIWRGNHWPEPGQERVPTGITGILRGERHGNAKLTDDLVRQIRARVANGTTSKALAHELGLGANTVYRVVKRETWGHVA